MHGVTVENLAGKEVAGPWKKCIGADDALYVYICKTPCKTSCVSINIEKKDLLETNTFHL